MSTALLQHAHPSDTPQRDAPRRDIRGPVVSKAALRAATLMGLTNGDLAEAIGVSVPTVSRLRAGTKFLQPGEKPYELALMLVRLFRGLDAIAGGDERSVASWMVSPNQALGGIPREMVRTVLGLVQAVMYVDAARARI